MSMFVRTGVFAFFLGFAIIAPCAFAADDAPVSPAPEAAASPAPEVAASPAPLEPAIVPIDQMPQGVIAMVGDEKITGAELDREMKRASRGGRGGAMAPAEQQKQVLDNLIDRRIVIILAKKAGVTVDPKEVDDILAEQKKNYPSDDDFKKQLSKAGLTEDDFRSMISESMLLRNYMEQTSKTLTVSEEELNAKYEELKEKDQLKSLESADVAHILVKVDGTDEATWAEAKKKIDAARERVMKGEAFGDVVKDVSDDPGSKNNGGEYKDTKRGQMVPEFDQLTFSQVVGEVSAPFRTQFGWHILKVLKRTDPKEKLKELMLNQKAGEFVQGLIDKAKAEIPIKMVELPEPPPSAPQIMPMPAPVQK